MRTYLGLYNFAAVSAAPYITPAFVLSEDEMNQLLDAGARVARWYPLPKGMSEKMQDHVALAFTLYPIFGAHLGQAREYMALKRAATPPAPAAPEAGKDVPHAWHEEPIVVTEETMFDIQNANIDPLTIAQMQGQTDIPDAAD